MSFIAPMLAQPFSTFLKHYGGDIKPGQWVAELKYDGERLIVEKTSEPGSLLEDFTVKAWSRDNKDRSAWLPAHIRAAFGEMPDGIYDGEVVAPGERSFGVKRLTNQSKLVFVVFDVLKLDAFSKKWPGLKDGLFDLHYNTRRASLVLLFNEVGEKVAPAVVLAKSWDVETIDDIYELRDRAWANGEEGLILKKRDSVYTPGKRPKDWVKIKQLQTAVLEVVGFLPGTGSIVETGPYAIVVLRDEEGNTTTVRTKNYMERAKLEKMDPYRNAYDTIVPGTAHPALGRKLRIEFQERTPDGSYRHPRWDRWEDE